MLRWLFNLLVVGVIAAGGYVWWVTRNLPSMDVLLSEDVSRPPIETTQVLAADGSVIYSNGQFRHRNVKLNDVSPHFINALLATEDRRFFDHFGVDPIGLARALAANLSQKGLREGGSTITQQLVRNLFLSSERSINRKVREAALAIQLEQRLSKDQILELYINNIYFGEGAYGIEAACRVFFDKAPSELTVPEAALLAGMPQAPSRYSPFHSRELAQKRRDEVLQNMAESGMITMPELKTYRDKSLRVSLASQNQTAGNRAPFFNQRVREKVQQWFDLDEQGFWQSGLRIYTTYRPRAQRLAEQAVMSQTAAFGRTAYGQEAALLAIDPHSGAVVAYVGGRSYKQSQYDRVSQALRSPGSLFKVFTYTKAIEQGFPPNRMYLDEPLTIGGWSPTNYDKTHHGYLTLAQALAQSNNVVAVKVMQELGSDAVADVARRMGVQTPLKSNLSLTLGGSSVTLMDMVTAFSVLANQGVHVEPYMIERITDARGNLIYQHRSAKNDALSPATANTMVTLLKEVVNAGTGRRAQIGRPAAGKTGTSDNHRDAWFVGFTPDLVAGVWVGNDNNTPMRGTITGGTLPASVWRAFMLAYLADQPAKEFDLPYTQAVESTTVPLPGDPAQNASAPGSPLFDGVTGGEPGPIQSPEPELPDPEPEPSPALDAEPAEPEEPSPALRSPSGKSGPASSPAPTPIKSPAESSAPVQAPTPL
ncbi:MAG: PBP1A family penicillin-binding protein [Candidatus Melainabacteria bacterium]|nr:PBP1A family penicillin-binding protein [Candidatus Melainabacteria bacterium]